MNHSVSPDLLIRDVVASAERRRRSQAALRTAARLAPVSAAGIAAVALVARLAGWPGILPILLVAAVGGAWLVYMVRARRVLGSTDEMAATVDSDAGLAGELRSAHWFTSAPAGDAWTAFHVQHAAARAAAVQWTAVYPRVAARRAWMVTAALTAVSLAAPFTMPSWRMHFWPAPLSRASNPTLSLDALPADLRLQLLDAVTAIAKGEISAEDALATLTQMEAFNALDVAAQQHIAELLQKAQTEGSAKMFANANGGEPVSAAAAKWAKENLDMILAGKEEGEKAEDKDATAGKQEQAEQRNEYTEEGAAGETGEASDFQASTRVRTKPDGAAETNQPMPMSGSPDASGEAGTGFGGKHGDVRYGTTKAAELTLAFKQEVVQADASAGGATSESEKRRKTEQSRSAMSYTRVAGQVSFDRARVDAPRSVPEARRPLVERYFVRERENR